MRDGVFRWLRSNDAEAEAFRFSSVLAAHRVIERGFSGTAGVVSEIVEVR